MQQLALIKPDLDIPKINPVQLHDTQQQLKRQFYEQIRQGYKRVMIVAPCAYGKTILAASIVYDAAVIKSKSILFIVPFTCLISQTLETFSRYNIPTGIIAGGYKEDSDCNVQIATIQTLAMGRDISWFNYDLCIVDESHVTSWSRWHKANYPLLKDGKFTYNLADFNSELSSLGLSAEHNLTYDLVKQTYKNLALENHPDRGGNKETMQQINNAWETIKNHKDLFEGDRAVDNRILIGLTATPWRLSKRESMGDIFETQVLAPTPGEMIKQGYLVPCIYYGIKGADLKGVHTVAGDFDLGALEVKCADLEVITSAIDNYQKICPDRLFICFATTVRHAQLLTLEFNKRGIKTAIITGETPDKERESIFEKIKALEYQGVISVNCLSIGFNLPEISCILHCRPTKSMTLWIQGVGRGMRLAPWINKENCIVLDQAGNVRRHGFIEDITYPKLRQSQEIEKGEIPIKQCPECEALIRTFAKICPQCAYEFPEPEKKKPVGKMSILVRDEDKAIFNFYRAQLKRAYSQNYSPFWAYHEVERKFKIKPWYAPREWAYQAVFGANPTDEDKRNYLRYLEKVARKNSFSYWWVEMHMKNEFGSE